MSDVAVVAAITGGTSVLTSAITAAVTFTVSSNSAKVELTKVEAENERLRQNTREEERRNRQSTYHEYLNSVLALYQLMNRKTDTDEVNAAVDSYRYLHAGVVLFGPPVVRVAAYAVSEVFSEIGPAVLKSREANPQGTAPEWWQEATAELQAKFGEKIVELNALMHADVTQGITEDPAV